MIITDVWNRGYSVYETGSIRKHDIKTYKMTYFALIVWRLPLWKTDIRKL